MNIKNVVIYKEFSRFSFGKVDVEIRRDEIKMWYRDDTSIFEIVQNELLSNKYMGLFIEIFNNLAHEGFINNFGTVNIHRVLSADGDEYNKIFTMSKFEEVND
jgi:hypothetical protein